MDLFEIVGTKSLDSNAITFVKNGINFVGRTFSNNGIQGKIDRRNFPPNEPNTITATVIGNYKYVKYQEEEYYCSQNINKLTPKSTIEKWNKRIAYYFVTLIKKFVSLYDGQQGGYKLDDIKNYEVKIPMKKGKIDFEFIENFVAELEVQRVTELEIQRIAELEAYLNVTGLKNYELTEEENNILNNFETMNLDEFKINNLFYVNSSKKRFDANKVSITENIGHPYVVRTALNNGIKGYINEDEQFLNSGNTISFGQDTATMFYQENSYFTGDKIKVLRSKDDNFNKKRALYFITSMAKSFKTFTWGASSFNENVINNQLLTVPVIDNEIDYTTIELLISAIQKLVIKDVVKYTDMKIKATKKVINN